MGRVLGWDPLGMISKLGVKSGHYNYVRVRDFNGNYRIYKQ